MHLSRCCGDAAVGGQHWGACQAAQASQRFSMAAVALESSSIASGMLEVALINARTL
jgi:hypothetical protein